MEKTKRIEEETQFKTNNMMMKVDPDGVTTVPTEINGVPLQLKTAEGYDLIPRITSFQKIIDGPPATKEQLYSKACNNDTVTVSSWAEQWIGQGKENGKKYDFIKDSVMAVHAKEAYKPVIIAGSGPSIKQNAHMLKERPVKLITPDKGEHYVMGGGRKDIRIVSCLHNFGFFEDNDIMGEDDYYVNLDAGEITIREVYEGSKNGEDWCWDRTKDRTLVACTYSHPGLLEKWQGRILFYSTPPASAAISAELMKQVDYTKVPAFNVGGNALGAVLYMAKAILGAGPIIFVGADFSFGYTRKFHGWDSPYDAQFSGLQSCTDIYGATVHTWPSYFNFKCWFDYIACSGAGNNPQLFINATEGGVLGAYPEGNIRQIIQMTLKDALSTFTMHTQLKDVMKSSKKMVTLLF